MEALEGETEEASLTPTPTPTLTLTLTLTPYQASRAACAALMSAMAGGEAVRSLVITP